MKQHPPVDRLYRSGHALAVPTYTIADASRYLRIPQATVRSWTAGRSVKPSARRTPGNQPVILPAATAGARLSFLNLAELYVLDTLRRQYRLKLPEIRRAVAYLRRHFETDWPLAQQAMLTDGRSLFVELALGDKEPAIVNASRNGQLEMRDIVALYLKRIDWDENGVASRLYPLVGRRGVPSDSKAVVIDPRIAFGRPAVASIGVPAATIADRFAGGESIEELAEDYGAAPTDIQEAIRFALPLAHAA